MSITDCDCYHELVNMKEMFKKKCFGKANTGPHKYLRCQRPEARGPLGRILGGLTCKKAPLTYLPLSTPATVHIITLQTWGAESLFRC